MKKIILLVATILNIHVCYSQANENEYIKAIGSGTLDIPVSTELVNDLNDAPKEAFTLTMNHIFSTPKAYFTSQPHQLLEICNEVSGVFDNINNGDKNYAIIFVYRTMTNMPLKIGETETSYIDVDVESINTLIFHKTKIRSAPEWSNYLLETKKIFIVYIDLPDSYYLRNKVENSKKLANTTFKIERKTSFFKQSAKDMATVVKELKPMSADKEQQLTLTIIQIDPKRIKAPCDIVLSNKSFKEDIKIPVHELNLASFQVGLTNNKLNVNNFSISNGNLVVTPDATQKEEWKSNFYALIEVHAPRDIDNFRPVWQDAFGLSKDKRNFLYRLYTISLQRIGVYGGVKISKDPLSNIYLGFNYALTKELAINLGWTWTNEVVPQVTSIGDISSLDDAMKYAKRQYSIPKFSWGLSFAPSQVISMLGLK